MADLFEIIERQMKAIGVSTAQIAAHMGITQRMVEFYLKGEKNPSFKNLQKLSHFLKFDISELSEPRVPHETLNEEPGKYLRERRERKLTSNNNTLLYYEVNANAGLVHSPEILPVNKNEGVLHISDLFKGSQYAIRISGNSMIPGYPPGAIIGIREIEDKRIVPGTVYVLEKGNDLWIKRLFYKDDNQGTGIFQCVSDNTMKHLSGPREGKFFYPSFEIEIDKVRRLFKVTGIYKANDLTIIN